MLSDQIIGLAIASLQTGATVGNVTSIILNAAKLEIVALDCKLSEQAMVRPILSLQDIRQLTYECVIIDSIDEISDAHDIVRLQKHLMENFHLQGLSVVTSSGKKLGKVDNFTINTTSMMVQKLYIQPTFFTSLVSGTLTIDRSQILDVTPKQITVKDSTSEVPAKTIVALPNISPNLE